MKTTINPTVTIGQGVTIDSYSTTQRGYGRQSLYARLRIDVTQYSELAQLGDRHGILYVENVYLKDVFPNILEHYQDSFYLREYTAYDDEREVYTRDSGDGEYTEDQLFNSTLDLLNHVFNNEDVDITLEVEQQYIVSWDSNGMQYIANYSDSSTQHRENARLFDSEEEAQGYIDECCGDHCSVEEYYI